MSQMVSAVVHDDNISEYAIVTLIAISTVMLLLGLISLVSPQVAGWPADASALALFYI